MNNMNNTSVDGLHREAKYNRHREIFTNHDQRILYANNMGVYTHNWVLWGIIASLPKEFFLGWEKCYFSKVNGRMDLNGS
jgi:hypothetical protein